MPQHSIDRWKFKKRQTKRLARWRKKQAEAAAAAPKTEAAK